MNDRVDPDLFALATVVGQNLRKVDQITEKHSNSQPNAFRLDVSQVVRPVQSNPYQVDPYINMPDPAAHLTYDMLPPEDRALLGNIPPPPEPISIPQQTNIPQPQTDDNQLELGFGQVTVSQLFDKLDALENLLIKINKKLK